MPLTNCIGAVVVLLIMIGDSIADEPKLEKVTSKEGKFTVEMPGKPKESSKEINTPNGATTMYLFSLDGGAVAHLVTYSDHPAKVVKDLGTDKCLDNVRDGNVKGIKGKLVDERKITIGKNRYPGRELIITFGDSKAYRARIYFVDNRLYQIIYTGTEEGAKEKAVDAYLESFQLNE
jgi:hypothetical protein